MARNFTPNELVEAEISRLNKKPTVKLAQKEQRIIAGRRKRLADLRWLDKRGEVLEAMGWTLDTIDLMYQDNPEDDRNSDNP